MNSFIDKKINREAVFSDETPFFRFPTQPSWKDRVWVRIRTFTDDVDRVEILTDRGTKILMEKEKSEGYFDYYRALFLPDVKNLRYCFCLHKKDETVFYSKVGVSDYRLEYADFTVIRDYNIPIWSKGRIIYQIYVDRFFNGDESNDVKCNEYVYLGRKVKKVSNWNKEPENQDVWNFYGGDLRGIIKKLQYLKELGVEAIYLNPIFVSPSNHKYDIQDYEHIDPHLGEIVYDSEKPLNDNDSSNYNANTYRIRTTNNKNLIASDEVFIELVRKVHGLGIKVILDGVFNHCGAFNKWLDKEKIYEKTENYSNGALNDKSSIYRDYFIWKEDGTYEGWWGYENHPKLNYEGSNALFNEMMNIAKKWVQSPFNADGWRLDVASDLGKTKEFNHFFWQEFRKAVKSAKPEALILAEHYGDAFEWLQGNEWDTIMNYDAFMEPVSYFLTGMEKHSDSFNGELLNNGKAFANTMVQKMARLPIQALITSMNQLSNHDHSRFLTRTNKKEGRVDNLGSAAAVEGIDKAVFREAVLIQMTWVGSPTIYYGDEAGLCGFTDPDNRRSYPWGNEDNELIEYHKELIKIRKEKEVLTMGSTMFLVEDKGIICYARFNEREKILIAINNNTEERILEIPVWKTGVLEEKFIKIFETNILGFNKEFKEFKIKDGHIKMFLKERSGVILSDGD